MKSLIISSLIILLIVACKKEENDIMKFKIGTYCGKRYSQYENVNFKRIDTVTIYFDSIKYNCIGTYIQDFGSGNYYMNIDSIGFKDENARIALYSWEWILSGMYKYKTNGDSLFLFRSNKTHTISYRLKRTK